MPPAPPRSSTVSSSEPPPLPCVVPGPWSSPPLPPEESLWLFPESLGSPVAPVPELPGATKLPSRDGGDRIATSGTQLGTDRARRAYKEPQKNRPPNIVMGLIEERRRSEDFV